VRFQNCSKSQADYIAPDVPAAVHEAFTDFCTNKELLALPLALHNGSLEPLLPVQSSTSFQVALNELSTVLNPRTALYILLRRTDTLTAITFVPYLAKDNQQAFFLEHRLELVEKLGKQNFSQSLICKEIGEVTDARSWTERDNDDSSKETTTNHSKDPEVCQDDGCEACTVQDLGYKRNKCRLCDRRMQNKVSPEALEALKILAEPSTVVQIVRSQALLLHFVPQLIIPDRQHFDHDSRPHTLLPPHSPQSDTFPPPPHPPNIHILPSPLDLSYLLHLPLARHCDRAATHDTHHGNPRPPRARRRRGRACGCENRDTRAQRPGIRREGYEKGQIQKFVE
jgi:hypothetical protein